MKRVTGTVLKGLGAILPISLSLYLLFWLLAQAESLMRSIYLTVIPAEFYFPGLGTLLALVVLFITGLLVQTFFIRYVMDLSEKLINRIPLVKSLYSGIKDFVGFVSSPTSTENRKVVAVTMPDGSKLIGLVTGETAAKELFKGADANRVGVYIPLSYQIAGLTIYAERDRLELLDISVEDALRLCMTAGMGSGKGVEGK